MASSQRDEFMEAAVATLVSGLGQSLGAASGGHSQLADRRRRPLVDVAIPPPPKSPRTSVVGTGDFPGGATGGLTAVKDEIHDDEDKQKEKAGPYSMAKTIIDEKLKELTSEQQEVVRRAVTKLGDGIPENQEQT
eukprot:TRINITY_DN37009_c0_g1_i1.p1 TRINITY_DN37009_c0_g1~~TRINITY_DN37009_c0_g1_i1.p1  ORF type:complete len:135 (-),score=29.64 TRINITY_DN37009_c0_g1_i1:35-439(-)